MTARDVDDYHTDSTLTAPQFGTRLTFTIRSGY
jgi:hypothetical protein